ncbi:DUF6615 family protein [Streptomyces sp. NPDC050698]
MTNTELRSALVRGREAVDETVAFWLAVNSKREEETATARLCERSAPYLRPITFNRPQEARIGADWLWWFIDRDTDRCFGMLCQAKNLKKDGKRWTIGFDQANKNGMQIKLLLSAADSLDVPATYVLYCGNEQYRAGLQCRTHPASDCTICPRAGVSVLSALGAEYLYDRDPTGCAVTAFQRSQPLEDLVAPKAPDGAMWEVNFESCTGDVQKFLNQPQYGAARVAKQLFDQVSALRSTVFTKAHPSFELAVVPRGNPVYDLLPADRGHFSRPYFRDVLRGLRRSVPQYVRDAEAGRVDRLPAEVTAAVDKIIITYL